MSLPLPLPLSSHLSSHQEIQDKLTYFYTQRKVPNLLLHGPAGCGKSTLLNHFLSQIYQGDSTLLDEYVMHVNCSADVKGIQFIRDQLKLFCQTNRIGDPMFKSIVLYNGDKLTTDAQSALRRCIELYMKDTRFFILAEDKSKLLRPILSRFCDIYVGDVSSDGSNLYKQFNPLESLVSSPSLVKSKSTWLKKHWKSIASSTSTTHSKPWFDFDIATLYYNRGYTAMEVATILLQPMTSCHIDFMFTFHQQCKEVRYEPLLILHVLLYLSES